MEDSDTGRTGMGRRYSGSTSGTTAGPTLPRMVATGWSPMPSASRTGADRLPLAWRSRRRTVGPNRAHGGDVRRSPSSHSKGVGKLGWRRLERPTPEECLIAGGAYGRTGHPGWYLFPGGGSGNIAITSIGWRHDIAGKHRAAFYHPEASRDALERRSPRAERQFAHVDWT
jgi:hypothetical protein